MAKSAGPSKPPKPSRSEKKAARGQRREQRRETWRNLRQAFTLTRKSDAKLIPLMVTFAVVAAAVVYVAVLLLSGSPYYGIPLAVLAAALAGMLIFSRRAQSSMFAQAEGQPGAAGYMLSQQLKGDWRLTQAVAGNTQLDVVHRLVGRPGVVLVGEGNPSRVRGLIAQEKRNVARIDRDVPIYDFVVGTGENETKLAKIRGVLLKLPPNLSKEQVNAVDKKLKAIGSLRAAMPQGPMPPGAKMRNVQRTVRRRS